MQSPKEFAQSIQDASSFVILNDNKVQFVNIDMIANMIEWRDEEIRERAYKDGQDNILVDDY